MLPSDQRIRLSVSKTKTFADCKKKYRFTYIDKLPRKDHDFLTYGKFVHQILENYHQFYLDNPGSDTASNVIMAQAFSNACEEYKGQLTKEQKKEAFESIDSYLKKIEEEKKSETDAQILSCEKEFGVTIDGDILLIGYIDRIQIDRDGILHVADYKTTKQKKYLKNDWFQLLVYSYVLMMEDPSLEKIRGSYILIRHAFEYISKDFSRAEVMTIKDKILKYADDIKKEQLFRASPTFLCKWCDHLDVCTEGKALVKPESLLSHGKTTW